MPFGIKKGKGGFFVYNKNTKKNKNKKAHKSKKDAIQHLKALEANTKNESTFAEVYQKLMESFLTN